MRKLNNKGLQTSYSVQDIIRLINSKTTKYGRTAAHIKNVTILSRISVTKARA
jgi:hypothetical protein